MLTHDVSRRSCAITSSRNVYTDIHGAILCHTVCNQAWWRIQVSRRYWDRQPILGVSSCYVQCHHLSHSTQSNNMGRSSRGQSLGSTTKSQSRLPEEKPDENDSLATLPPLLAVTGIDSPWTGWLSEVHHHQSHSRAPSVFETSSNINARGLPAGVVVVQRARIAVPSSTAPPSVTASGTEEDGTL